jgi:hypothetical protein
VFGLIATNLSYEKTGGFSPAIVFTAAGAGLLIGLVVWFCYRPSGRGKFPDVSDQGTFLGRFLALVSSCFFWLPVIGLFLSGWAVFINRRRSAGWSWIVSRIAFVLAVLWSGVFVALLLFVVPKH